MNRKIVIGLICGLVAGVIDLIPMLIQKLPWDANLGALSMWIVAGYFISTSNLRIPSIVNGILVSLLCLLPSSFIIVWNGPFAFVPILAITIILGGLLGFAIDRLSGKY